MVKDNANLYAPNYKVIDRCLYEVRQTSHGPVERKLCNFAAWIERETIVDDGAEQKRFITLCGEHEDGHSLRELTISADELSSFYWLGSGWGMKCNLETSQGVKDSLRYAIQSTAQYAEQTTEYAVTGWKKIDGKWQFLMPGDDAITVSLPGKMQGYHMERDFSKSDAAAALSLLESNVAPPEILYPLMAYTFLSPLNHFLKLAGCEPKFVLFLCGKTGSRKSTLAALFLSFFGKFTGTDLPLSFRDTPNSILHHAFSLKDVLTCIDDFHPAGRFEVSKLTATAQSIMRAYGDRTGRGRLRADSTPMESRQPQGNVIITGEFPPDIGESGTARYFALELKEGDVNLDELTRFQLAAAEGFLQRCMFGFTDWLQFAFLDDDDAEYKFADLLKERFNSYRSTFLSSGVSCHGRIPEAIAWLRIGMDLFCAFLQSTIGVTLEERFKYTERCREILYRLAARQAESITQDKPTHIFIRKLYALLESNQVCVLQKNSANEFTPLNCVGYEDDEFYYLFAEMTFKAVKKLCDEQGEVFSISQKGLLKQLAEEGLIDAAGTQNTKPVRIGSTTKRFLCLNKAAAESLRDGTL